jgi:exodeoxyribonuclease VII small subunit
MTEDSTAPQSFEEAMALLEESVERLESGALTLEESLLVFERGVAASRVCGRMLDQTRKRVQVLIEKVGGEFELEFLQEAPDQDIDTGD